MKARWFWSRWLLPPCHDEIHHSCREAERMLQACGEETLMTAVNSIPFYFHSADITLTLRHHQGFPLFSCCCRSGTSFPWALVSLVSILLDGDWRAAAAGERRWLATVAAAWRWNLMMTNSSLSWMNFQLLIGLLLWWLFWKAAEWSHQQPSIILKKMQQKTSKMTKLNLKRREKLTLT